MIKYLKLDFSKSFLSIISLLKKILVMKKLTVIIFLLSPIFIFSQINIDSLNRNNAYRVGEKLIYSVKYGLIKGGEASLELNIKELE